MFSELFHIGPLRVHPFGLMMAIAFLSGLFAAMWLAKRRGRDFEYCSDLMFWTVASGVVGARLTHVAANLGYFLDHPADIIRLDKGGLIFYGGFAGAAVALWIFSRRRRVPLLDVADLVLAVLPLGHAFGRIGCFLNGCCHGIPCSCALGVRYPPDSAPYHRQVHIGAIAPGDLPLPVHPVQLYEALANVFIFAFLSWSYRRGAPLGRVTALYLIAYPPVRFALEFLRGDLRQPGPFGLNATQWLSIVLFLCGLAALRATRRTPDAASPEAKPLP